MRGLDFSSIFHLLKNGNPNCDRMEDFAHFWFLYIYSVFKNSLKGALLRPYCVIYVLRCCVGKYESKVNYNIII